jgi:hypothetical protein
MRVLWVCPVLLGCPRTGTVWEPLVQALKLTAYGSKGLDFWFVNWRSLQTMGKFSHHNKNLWKFILLMPVPQIQIHPGLSIYVLGPIIRSVGKWMTTGETGKFHNYHKLTNNSCKLQMSSETWTSSYIHVTALTLQIHLQITADHNARNVTSWYSSVGRDCIRGPQFTAGQIMCRNVYISTCNRGSSLTLWVPWLYFPWDKAAGTCSWIQMSIKWER